MTLKTKPSRTEVCIIGAGASGAAAAKVLTERGVRVVALERGPWRGKETFGGDELANINRYNLWPDPLLNPRTARTSPDEKAHLEMFCPVPQMVGGGTVHWQGWLPRFTPNDFRIRTIAGEVHGATLADWPISYDELEPYYAKVEWAFGVSGRAGANKFEGPRSVGYPCPPLPVSRYAEKFNKGCDALGWNAFPTPQAALSRSFNGRKPTVISAFAQQHGDPTGTRSSALNVFVPDAVRTGRYDLRADCYVRELSLGADGAVKSAIYQDADGDLIEQQADVFILACGAVEVGAAAPAVEVGQISQWPRQRQRSRRAQCDLSRIQRRGRPVRRSDLRVGRRRLCQRLQLPVLRTRRKPRPCQRGAHRLRGRRHSLADQLASAGCAGLGAAAKQNDHDNFNHSMAVAMVLHDMPRHDNRVDLDDEVEDAWGLPVARITLSSHENDMKQGRFLINRAADILEAAGSRRVQKVYAQRVTGNCSHQHGTLRMGTDPTMSVLDKYCRAHEVANLYAVDGSPFPTGTGANPTLTIMANAWRVAEKIVERRGARG